MGTGLISNQDELFRTVFPCDIIISPENEISQQEIITGIMDREAVGSTGIGEGLAIPHAKLYKLHEPLVRTAVVTNGLAFNAIDKKPCYCFIFIMANGDSPHLKILARISRLYGKNKESFVRSLVEAGSREQAFHLMKEKEGV